MLTSELVTRAAWDIECNCAELLHAIREAQTVNDALALHHLALTLEQELARVTRASLDRADALCGA